METITIPDSLAARLRARAEANRRTLDAEATRLLEEAVAGDRSAAQEASLADQIRAFRESLTVQTFADEIVQMVRDDRDADHGRA